LRSQPEGYAIIENIVAPGGKIELIVFSVPVEDISGNKHLESIATPASFERKGIDIPSEGGNTDLLQACSSEYQESIRFDIRSPHTKHFRFSYNPAKNKKLKNYSKHINFIFFIETLLTVLAMPIKLDIFTGNTSK
jgi:hypothetical protein